MYDSIEAANKSGAVRAPILEVASKEAVQAAEAYNKVEHGGFNERFVEFVNFVLSTWNFLG